MSEPIKLVTRAELTIYQTDAVDVLRDALARAEAGEFLGVAVVAQLKDSSIHTHASAAENVHLLVAGLSKLTHRIHCGE